MTIPDSVISIGDYAFSGCTSLNEIHILNLSSWCRIDFKGRYANPLSGGANLCINGKIITDLIVPFDITEIKFAAFRGCKSLKNITIHENVTSIGEYAFWGCNIKTVICKAEIPPIICKPMVQIGNEWQNSFKHLETIIIPTGKEKLYMDSDWGRYIREEIVWSGDE